MRAPKFYLFVYCTLLMVGCTKDPIFTEIGTFTDARDQHVYKWVKIGTQTWMAENLAFLPAVSPSSDESDTAPFYYVYDYEGSSIIEAKSTGNYRLVGGLYNWEAAITACPLGWHLPTDAEWSILEDYLGRHPGKKMKSKTGWLENGNGDNSSGFNALPGGWRTYVGFRYQNNDTYFWLSTKEPGHVDIILLMNAGLTARSRNLICEGDEVLHWNISKRGLGFSVRCLKDSL